MSAHVLHYGSYKPPRVFDNYIPYSSLIHGSLPIFGSGPIRPFIGGVFRPRIGTQMPYTGHGRKRKASKPHKSRKNLASILYNG